MAWRIVGLLFADGGAWRTRQKNFMTEEAEKLDGGGGGHKAWSHMVGSARQEVADCWWHFPETSTKYIYIYICIGIIYVYLLAVINRKNF